MAIGARGSAVSPLGQPLEGPGTSRHLIFYGLTRPPFRPGATDPVWMSEGQRTVLDTLASAIQARPGVFLLTGDVGTGKTFLAGRLADGLEQAGMVVGRISVSSPGLDREDLFEALLNAYGGRQIVQVREAFHAAFRQTLRRVGGERARALAVIDEAQSLRHELLQEIAALSAAAAAWPQSLAILLVGESRLSATLAEDRHASLAARIVARCAIPAFAPDEVAAYVRHCLAAAGAKHPVFQPDALSRIASIAEGAPGAIHIVADRALVLGALRREQRITAPIVEDACRQPEPERTADVRSSERPAPRRAQRRPGGRRRIYAVGLAALVLLASGSYITWWLTRSGVPASQAARDPADTGGEQGANAAASHTGAPVDAEAETGPALPPRDLSSTKRTVEPALPPSIAVRRPPVATRSIDGRSVDSPRPLEPPDRVRPDRRTSVPLPAGSLAGSQAPALPPSARPFSGAQPGASDSPAAARPPSSAADVPASARPAVPGPSSQLIAPPPEPGGPAPTRAAATDKPSAGASPPAASRAALKPVAATPSAAPARPATTSAESAVSAGPALPATPAIEPAAPAAGASPRPVSAALSAPPLGATSPAPPPLAGVISGTTSSSSPPAPPVPAAAAPLTPAAASDRHRETPDPSAVIDWLMQLRNR